MKGFFTVIESVKIFNVRLEKLRGFVEGTKNVAVALSQNTSQIETIKKQFFSSCRRHRPRRLTFI